MSNINLIAGIKTALYLHDPMKIGTVEHALYDEYDIEAETIAHNINKGEVKNKEDMKACVIFVFNHYFGEVFDELYITDDLIDNLLELIL